MRKILICLAFVVFGYQAASAATLTGVQGQVLVNTGNGFRNAEPGQTINPGDRVLVQQGGSAQVSFPNGTVLNVPPGGAYTIPVTPPVGAPAVGAFGGGIPTTGIIIGGAAAVGAGVLIYQATKSSSP